MHDWLAYTGGAILGLQIIPQIVKIYQTRSAKDLSYLFMLSNIVGVAFMFVYGFVNGDHPLYITTGASVTSMIVAISMKLWADSLKPTEIVGMIHTVNNALGDTEAR
jgi:MtN3 and saliva related transmembrane protein